MIMRTASEQNTTIDETITMNINQSIPNRGLIGKFIGVGDGIHKTEVLAKILTLSNGSQILRLEDLFQIY